MMSKGSKPHWISEFLTAPWEINERGDLRFYDFETGRLGRPTPSARLFRESRCRNTKLEQRLNALLESPLSRVRSTLLAPGQVRLDDWKAYRAIVLTILLQSGRTAAMKSRDDGALTPILEFSDETIEQLVGHTMRHKQLVRLGSSHPNHSLFYPSTGLFGVLTRDRRCATGWTWGFAVPLSPAIAIALISDTADCDWLFERCATGHHLQALSLAGPKAQRVVIPPALAGSGPEPVLAMEIARYRRDMNHYRARFQELRTRSLDVLRKAGRRLLLVDPATQRYDVAA